MHLRPFLISSLILLVAGPLQAADVANDLAALKALLAERNDVRVKDAAQATPGEGMRRMSDFSNRVCTEALKVYEAHPQDPLRWEAALIALRQPRSFVVDVKPGYEAAMAARDTAKIQSLIVRDEAARAAWDRRMDALEGALFAAPDVSPALLAEAYANAVYRVSLRRGAPPAQRWTAMEPLIAAMERKVTDPTMLTRAFEIATRTMQAADPAAYARFLQTHSQSPIPEISRWAAGKANLESARIKAVEMKFTAVDGREVDLAQLRGKVVLIDFWATWCGPCKEELPNVLANYRKYHDLGFEVVGVSLDREQDRQKLVDYAREQGLPWPQHFDGKGFKNEFAIRFSVRAIPAMFLLDQAGRVASTEARGAKLEPEIRRLLKLDDAPSVTPAGERTVYRVPQPPDAVPVVAADSAMLGAGAPAPDFVARDLAGNAVRLSDYLGQVLILDFWATWCTPCVASMPHTQAVAAKYADQGVAVLAVCTGDKRTHFEDWVRLKAANYPAIRFVCDPHEQGTPAQDQRASLALYRVPSIPTQFIIDREGRIVGTTSGYFSGDPSLEQALAAAGVKVDPAVLARRAPERKPPMATASAAPAVRRLPPPFTTAIARLKAGDILPDLDLQGVDGTPRKLSDFRGHPLVLMFVTAEMIPADFLDGVVAQYGAAGVQALALVTRDTRANLDAWLALHRERAHRFAIAFDPAPPEDPRQGAINRTFQFGAPTPFSIVVDAEGRFVGMFPWKVPEVGPQGLAELLRRCGITAGGGSG
ncbi:MAG: redoxin domain-containing protein [Opitutaceae bacterium]|nr:redoxin domain-containing protein [Opitutaceae bacterium]